MPLYKRTSAWENQSCTQKIVHIDELPLVYTQQRLQAMTYNLLHTPIHLPKTNQKTTHTSLHRHNRPQPLHRLNNLLRLLFRHPILHLLRRTLHKFLAVDQTQPQHALDLLDDFWLGGSLEGFESQGEKSLFLRCWGCFFFFGSGGGCWGCGTGGESAYWHVGDVEAGLVGKLVNMSV